MNKGIGRILLMAGAAVYILFLVMQLLSFMDNVGFLLMPMLSIILQAALALPILGAALGVIKLPEKCYAVTLGTLAGVLAIAGYLGMPTAAERGLSESWRVSLQKSEQSISESLGRYRILNLEIDLAIA